MKYGKAIRILRSARDLSQHELSKKADLDPSYISLIEKDKRVPTLDTLQKIVTLLDVPLYLFFLLAADKQDVNKLSPQKKSKIANILLEILLSSEKQGK
ncbi:MAG: helix-turn-helix transcriptional regulator [bacterium]|nr:helix-turn-helix transcriptional regulator [bacterium]